MKFEFKCLLPFEEQAIPNFMGEASMYTPSVVKYFESIEVAVQHVADHNGFIIDDDSSFAFKVKSIRLLK
ncbi:MAG TPA: hypothetical protein VGC17_01560 [Lactovum miscens]|uniref:hypothetical protein n=1 Tax=Lactovum miscens TaxID=190387 RepID=UPI002EDAB513